MTKSKIINLVSKPVYPLAKKHKTRRIPMKIAPIDIPMIPLVNWINSFELAFTTYCCQGNGPLDRPYITFHCHDQRALIMILDHLSCYATVEVVWSVQKSAITYIAVFHDLTAVKRASNPRDTLKSSY